MKERFASTGVAQQAQFVSLRRAASLQRPASSSPGRAVYRREEAARSVSLRTLRRSFRATRAAASMDASIRPSRLSQNQQGKEALPAPLDALEKFEWRKQWYAVGWERDFIPGRPTKVTLFDEDYVILTRSGAAPVCLLDKCPHRLAALSEGRMTESGHLQCAYHGWAFDGISGACVDVPQAGEPPANPRACATALPCMEAQGLVWVLPTPLTSEALLNVRGPVLVPEMSDPAFKVIPIVREFPIDYAVLMENLIDFDHGPFAHQNPGFDLYSGSAKYPQNVESVMCDDEFKIFMTTAAQPKSIKQEGAQAKSDQKEKVLMATCEFHAPCHVRTCRRDADGNTSFINAFWAVPTGIGRSRLLLAGVVKGPIVPPRWVMHIFLNNFLDQDTFLLATEQAYVLNAELDAERASTPLRRTSLYCYQSPGEKLLIAVGKYLDVVVPKMPNRYAQLTGTCFTCPPREVVLDRWQQHTALCPDSLRFVRICAAVRATAAVVSVVTLGGILTQVALGVGARVGTTEPMATVVCTIAGVTVETICRSPLSCIMLAVIGLLAWITHRLINEFKFKYTEEYSNRDLNRIAAVYPDAVN
ncbi:hypothetical protein CYMTET_55818 [Cymbomonas tetramitiformis]|uniref:Rieske domain-containing protein n=1 Tax=Cymbomonas tetramitiformis TaxID=36881 RepID=A0AAE0BDD2_9CHLO|nr:hypothetical protein CYMTET_55818 [Cymbomonas tetramitiformis]